MLHAVKIHPTLTLFLLVAAFACGGSGTTIPPLVSPPPPPPGTANSVVIRNNSFTPGDLSASKGAEVTWTWDACTAGDGYGNGVVCTSHNVVFADGTPGSVTQSSGTYRHTFPTAGTFAYHCSIHGVAMSGRVIVQ